MTADERPVLHALVCFPVEPDPDWWVGYAYVPLETAAEMQERGWIVLVDPQDERDLAMHERLLRALEPPIISKWPDA